MATNNNWLKTNIRERLTNPEIDFKVFFDPQPYEDMSFNHATKSVAYMIAEKYPKLFIAYSGGMDSEFVFHLFRKLKIEFTPIIVSSTSNTLETAYAFHECRKHDIKPIVVEKTDNEILKIFLLSRGF
jgi:tRNA(Ile)-lysidine synthase TilS/MesJ